MAGRLLCTQVASTSHHLLVHSSGFLDLQLVPELGPLCGPLRFDFDFGSALQIEMTPFECLCYELYRYCTSISSGMIPTGVLELSSGCKTGLLGR